MSRLGVAMEGRVWDVHFPEILRMMIWVCISVRRHLWGDAAGSSGADSPASTVYDTGTLGHGWRPSKSGSQLTRRWREMDSKPSVPQQIRSRFRDSSPVSHDALTVSRPGSETLNPAPYTSEAGANLTRSGCPPALRVAVGAIPTHARSLWCGKTADAR